MGFDLRVSLNVHIDPVSGIPFSYDFKTSQKKPFVGAEFIVPEKHRPYLIQRGPHFHAYIKPFGDMCNMTSADSFLHYYPNWSQVKKVNGEANDDWTKEDHDGFKAALKWMALTNFFVISWSY